MPVALGMCLCFRNLLCVTMRGQLVLHACDGVLSVMSELQLGTFVLDTRRCTPSSHIRLAAAW